MPLYAISPLNTSAKMFQQDQPREFFDMKALAPRPLSEVTEIFDTEFEDDSEIEEKSPRLSFNSSGRSSETAASSFEEALTPSPVSNKFGAYIFEEPLAQNPVEGPYGPHLFLPPVALFKEIEPYSQDKYDPTMSPMTRKPWSNERKRSIDSLRESDPPPGRRHLNSFTDAAEEALNKTDVAEWTPRQVARWMYEAGFEPQIAERFEENDISGAILITLRFEELWELGIPSLGQRTKVWKEIHILRGSIPAPQKACAPVEEIATWPCEDFKRARSKRDQAGGCVGEPRRYKSSRRHHRKHNGPITPLESVSIVGIEQLISRPNKCAKGEHCSKWRKQQRLIENLKKEHSLSPDGSIIWITGDPGKSPTVHTVAEAHHRPVSDAVPSVVASSDVLGPTAPTLRPLEEASLRNVQSRDPLENVRQFLQFQHVENGAWSSQQPGSPLYEMFPALAPPPESKITRGLGELDQLPIPPDRPTPRPRASSASKTINQDRVEVAALRNVTRSPSTAFYRFGTPFSEKDIPVTAIPPGPIGREISQSVPPNMSYRKGPVPAPIMIPAPSQTLVRRPSLIALPRVDEKISRAPHNKMNFTGHEMRPLRARGNTINGSCNKNKLLWSTAPEPTERTTDDAAHAGWMKKRKTRMLRHEWHEHYFTLKGTRLMMRKDDRSLDTLEYIDVDDYAIACSSLASGSKLNAAFKAMSISLASRSKDREAREEAAFSFQLIPASVEKGVRLKKSDSGALIRNDSALPEVRDTTPAKSKTHHFAVRSRDERIDWMRDLMLAKAFKQKSEGYEINMNGNII